MKFLLIFLFSFIEFSKAQNLPNVRAFFYDSTYSDSVNFTIANIGDFSSLPLTKFDASKRTEIFVHGWFEGPNVEGPQTIIKAFLAKKADLDINVVLIDWSYYSININYLGVAAKLNSVADTTRNILDSCKNQGLNIENTHLIGFSFGSVIAGRIGRWFKVNRSVSFPRITGLDPANFFGTIDLIFLVNGITKLQRSDATFVDVVHTNTGIFGDGNTRGHIDFWPNGGKNQPGSGTITLAQFTSTIFTSNAPYLLATSHIRAWRYYAESIGNSSAFISKQCSSTIYTDANCQGSVTTPMGHYTSSSVAGLSATGTLNFYCSTNAASPFSK